MGFKVRQSMYVCLAMAVLTMLSMDSVCASSTLTIKNMAQNFLGQFESFGKLLIATAYLAGLGFAVAASFKLKQHRDNPNQVPVGMPIALFCFSVFLVFLPSLYNPAGRSMFGSNAYSGGFYGGGVDYLPKGY